MQSISRGEDRKVYSVAAFNAGIAGWLARLPTVWVEGEVTELRRQERWASVFLTLKDPSDGSCLGVSMPRGQFDALRLDLADGDRVHVYGRPELYEARGEFRLRALSLERFGLGDHLAALERLKKKLADEGLFAAERKRPLPFLPRRIGLVTGNDAAAKRDVLTAITSRFPPASLVLVETYVQGPRAALAVVDALRRLSEAPDVDVIVVARGGGSFEDLLPFSDERLVRAVAACPVPIVTAVGHEQDTPLCDLAADVRASTPSVAGRLVVPDLHELRERLAAARGALERGGRRVFDRERQRLALTHERLGRAPALLLDRERQRLTVAHERLGRAPALLLERRRARLDQVAGRLRALSPHATLGRGYAIVRSSSEIVRSAAQVAAGDRVAVELAEGDFKATVDP
jgi:exodeoxyribonuclease VII large subunit